MIGNVHVLNADGEVKISLGNETKQPMILEYRGKQGNAIKALKLVVDHQHDLIEAWRQVHGEA